MALFWVLKVIFPSSLVCSLPPPMHACAYMHATHTLERGGGGEGRNKQFHLEAEIETLSLLNVQVFVPKKK